MQVITGKSKVYNDNFPKSLNIDKKWMTDKRTNAEKFNSYFINMLSRLAAKIPSKQYVMQRPGAIKKCLF